MCGLVASTVINMWIGTGGVLFISPVKKPLKTDGCLNSTNLTTTTVNYFYQSDFDTRTLNDTYMPNE